MITLQQHIDQQHGGNITAFAKAVGRSRPLVYRWIEDGALWINGRVYDPVTPEPVTATQPHQVPLVNPDDWAVEDGKIEIYTQGDQFDTELNAADLAAMTEALNNGS